MSAAGVRGRRTYGELANLLALRIVKGRSIHSIQSEFGRISASAVHQLLNRATTIVIPADVVNAAKGLPLEHVNLVVATKADKEWAVRRILGYLSSLHKRVKGPHLTLNTKDYDTLAAVWPGVKMHYAHLELRRAPAPDPTIT